MIVEQNGKKYKVESAISWLKNLHGSTIIEGEEFCKQCSCKHPCPTLVLILHVEQEQQKELDKPRNLLDSIGEWLEKNGFTEVTKLVLNVDWNDRTVRIGIDRLIDDDLFEFEHIPLQEKE